jgi:aryl-alcohol dehydrogenase-like predicted oxidoreductase
LTMRYRPLGQSGLTVSEIGFGTWGLGGTRHGAVAYGPTDDAESLRALRRAFDLGVTFYDTSDLYGFGHSEELLGQAFASVRSEVVLTTKAGFLDAATQNFSPAHLESALTASLRRLRTDRADVYLLHSPPLDLLRADDAGVRWLTDLKRRGLARAVGLSVRSPEDGLAALVEFDLDCLEVNFNLTDQRARENGLLEACEDRGVGVIVRTPLCFGFLTGAYAEGTFAAGDHRGRWSAAQRRRWHDAHALFGGDSAASTPVQLALRFCLSYPGVSTLIPGMLNCEQVEENVAAGGPGPLPTVERERMEALYRAQDFFLQPR